MRYSGKLVKTCTARVLHLPTHSRERRKAGGKGGIEGAKGEAGEGEQRPLVFKSASPNNRTSFGMLELHVLRWRMHHGVIEKKKNKNLSPCFSSVVALLQAEVFTESKVRGQRRFNTLV